MESLLRNIEESIFKGNADEARSFSKQALQKNISPTVILEKGMIPAMDRIGEDFSRGAAYIPDLLVAARAMAAGMDVLREVFVKSGIKPKGKIILGTVFGDVHDIGKNLAKMCFEGIGFEAIDLGVNVSADAFVEAYQMYRPDFIGLSALLTTTVAHMEEIIQKIRSFAPRAKFIVGGAAVTEPFAKKIGADCYAEDAPTGVKKAKEMLGLT